MATVGSGITDLTPSRGFAAQFATAMTVVVASGTGLPISTTQTLVGAILGIGFARGIAALNLTVIRNIISSWVVTLPAGAFFAIVIFYILARFSTSIIIISAVCFIFRPHFLHESRKYYVKSEQTFIFLCSIGLNHWNCTG